MKDKSASPPTPTDQGTKPRGGKKGGRGGSGKKEKERDSKGTGQGTPKGNKVLSDKPRPEKEGGAARKDGQNRKGGGGVIAQEPAVQAAG